MSGAALQATPEAGSALANLWIDVSMGQPLVEWFNQVARPDDIARVEHPSLVDTLEPIQNGHKLVVFKSIRDAQRAISVMGDRFDVIGYNLEAGPATPPDEQARPVEAVRFMHELAQQNGKLLAIGPDRNFALTYGAEIAPFVDIFVIQIQRIQTEPDIVHAYVLPLAEELRRANPDIQISAQVRTEGDVVALVDMLETLSGALDGVSILTSPETTDVAEALVAELRSRGAADIPTPSPTPETPAPTEMLPSPSPTKNPSPATVTPTPGPTATASQAIASGPSATPPGSTITQGSSVALLAGTLLIGAGSGALLVALIVRANRRS